MRSAESIERARIRRKEYLQSPEGRAKSLIKMKTAQHRESLKRRMCKYQQTMKGKFLNYKGNARTKSLHFDITREQFAMFWQKPCSYCGTEIATVGLDRIDSSLGYTVANIRSCCSVCNYMKRRLTTEVFLRHCGKIVAFLVGENA